LFVSFFSVPKLHFLVSNNKPPIITKKDVQLLDFIIRNQSQVCLHPTLHIQVNISWFMTWKKEDKKDKKINIF